MRFRRVAERRTAEFAEGTLADALMGSAIAGFFVSIIAAGLLWGLPTESTVSTPRSYTHTAIWNYSANPDFNLRALEEEGGPIPDPSVLEATVSTGQPVFIRTHPRLDVVVSYELTAADLADLRGGLRLVAVLSHPATGWEREIFLAEVPEFTETPLFVEASVDLTDWSRTLESVAAVAGGPSVFGASLRLEATGTALVGGQPIQDTFASAINFRVEAPTVMRLDSSVDLPPGVSRATFDPFHQARTSNVLVNQVSESEVTFFAWSMSIRDLRPLAVVGAVAALSTMVLLHALRMMAHRRGPLFKVMSRYDREIFDAPPELYIELTPIAIPVESFDDLREIAQLRRRPILRIVHDGSAYFLVSDRPNAVFMLEMRGPGIAAEIEDEAIVEASPEERRDGT